MRLMIRKAAERGRTASDRAFGRTLRWGSRADPSDDDGGQVESGAEHGVVENAPEAVPGRCGGLR
jgi:hypothetical protein